MCGIVCELLRRGCSAVGYLLCGARPRSRSPSPTRRSSNRVAPAPSSVMIEEPIKKEMLVFTRKSKPKDKGLWSPFGKRTISREIIVNLLEYDIQESPKAAARRERARRPVVPGRPARVLTGKQRRALLLAGMTGRPPPESVMEDILAGAAPEPVIEGSGEPEASTPPDSESGSSSTESSTDSTETDSESSESLERVVAEQPLVVLLAPEANNNPPPPGSARRSDLGTSEESSDEDSTPCTLDHMDSIQALHQHRSCSPAVVDRAASSSTRRQTGYQEPDPGEDPSLEDENDADDEETASSSTSSPSSSSTDAEDIRPDSEEVPEDGSGTGDDSP